MAPTLVGTASPRLPSSPLLRGLGSVAPVVLLILMLLLCFPFKRKKRQLSTRTLKRDLNASDLISVTKLEDRLNPEEKPLEEGKLHEGTSLPGHHAKRETNGLAAHLQHGNANSPKGMHPVSQNLQRLDKTRKFDTDHLGVLGPSQASSCPNKTSPNSLQFRKLPLTPKEAHVSRLEPLSQSTESQVYESIRDEERELRTRDWSQGKESSGLPAESSSSCVAAGDHLAGSAESGRKDARTAGANVMPSSGPGQLATALQGRVSQGQLWEATPEGEAPVQPACDMEKRLSAMYARVCKRPKASQPANHSKPTEQEEEEPPPLPEKHFEIIYESLNLDAEMQGGEMPSVGVPAEA
ncbi:uncharacterized protein LOC133384565 [Rhineura floridana]|uniref:uncharacterized protein LOC133384565 n=1 Tax=Rhineura floridana TaxID=261503 RepID=UPI002AC83D9D|nr:uncharacterized protein LOC133384565 [Rhineura floridana]